MVKATSPSTLVALVTGANRGIGLEVTRQLAQAGMTVILGSRNPAKGEAAAAPMIQAGLEVLPQPLDVTDLDSIAYLAQLVEQRFGRLDVLINNAGILYDTWQQASNADLAVVQEAIATNTLGPWRMAQAFLPLLKRSPRGRIVNVSSGAGALSSMGAGTPAYSTSKAALNAFTRLLGAELQGTGILVNAVCPGWVATDMGGSGGRPVEEGATSVVWAATLPDDGPTGGFFRDGKPLDW
ncbi:MULTISPECIES: SDR family oxidoreductase [Cyanophyceae]|uniref:SDR family oxidoreductase n=1 Tax=Cyanophyceae TaxID=3028117 RepID=UPI001687FB28|nr:MULTISPECIES: SDR family oxidoreductase [Cyanophyceae]MBD1919060.1 SDR family oxidoreductase [Phormidium sp. FACHB-77]MBD2033061.1 SDR family oxidoreductase [Phormidium sp. FACHB-322]MBD2053989.1 SDR family oxidoreductase [Leptolyngbya sp. FACHB-60]